MFGLPFLGSQKDGPFRFVPQRASTSTQGPWQRPRQPCWSIPGLWPQPPTGLPALCPLLMDQLGVLSLVGRGWVSMPRLLVICSVNCYSRRCEDKNKKKQMNKNSTLWAWNVLGSREVVVRSLPQDTMVVFKHCMSVS